MKRAKWLGAVLVTMSVCLLGCGKNELGFAGQSGQSVPAGTVAGNGDDARFRWE